jgi:tRNA (cmo5U34)-methyltransferase
VAAYDADMDLMHPNRHKMVEVILDVLAASGHDPELVVDLGTGTGFLLERLLRRFPACRAIAIDGARAMMESAKSRLGELAGRVEFVTADFREPAAFALKAGSVDAVVSAYALHHLAIEEKSRLIAHCHAALKPGAWFLNADLAAAPDDYLEYLTQEMRVRGIVERAAGCDARFADTAATRRFIEELERNEHDQPQHEADDLRLLKDAGFYHVSLFWKETREVVWGGLR